MSLGKTTLGQDQQLEAVHNRNSNLPVDSKWRSVLNLSTLFLDVLLNAELVLLAEARDGHWYSRCLLCRSCILLDGNLGGINQQLSTLLLYGNLPYEWVLGQPCLQDPACLLEGKGSG